MADQKISQLTAATTPLAGTEVVPGVQGGNNVKITASDIKTYAQTGLGTAATRNAGVAGGVATLDGGGTVPTSQLPAAVLGAVKYQGTWNASTNSPTLTSSTGTQGYYYVVSADGSTNLNGITDWKIGDWAIYNGSAWQKIDNTDAVTSVAGRTGTVTLTQSDVSGTVPINKGGTNLTATPTNGQLLIGNGTGYTLAAITAGTGITVTNGAGTITIAASGGGGSLTGQTDSASPFETSLGYQAGNANTGASNTFIGYQAGLLNTSGNSNVVLGYQALDASTTSSNNVAIGSSALTSQTTAYSNVAVGKGTGQGTTTGAENTFIGDTAGYYVTTGGNNTLIGSGAGQNFLFGQNLTTGTNNIIIGRYATTTNGSASNRIIIGNQSNTELYLPGLQVGKSSGDVLTFDGSKIVLQTPSGGGVTTVNGASGAINLYAGSNVSIDNYGTDIYINAIIPSGGSLTGATPNPFSSGIYFTALGYGTKSTYSGDYLTSIGAMSGPNITTASTVCLVGSETGGSMTTGARNTAIGERAMQVVSVGSDNTALGAAAMLGAASNATENIAIGVYSAASMSGRYNVAIGNYSLYSTSGYYNTSIGSGAGISISSGENNTILGAGAASTLSTGGNNTVIGRSAEPSSGGASNQITLGNSSITTLRCQATTITSLSDARDKTDVAPLAAGIDFVNALNPVSFTWDSRDGSKVGVADAGFIAQDLQAAQDETGINIPGLVYDDNPDRLEASYGKLIPVLVKAIQELSAKVAELEAKAN
jgi:hypothetical protein